MENYIIEIRMKVKGNVVTYYHEDIISQKNNQVMNMYVENITSERKKAKVFYDKQEAERIGVLFSSKHQVASVLTIK